MKLQSKRAKFAVYSALIALNILSFYAFYMALQDDRQPSAELQGASLEEKSAQGAFTRLRRQIFGSKESFEGTSAIKPAKLSTPPDQPKFSRTSFFFQAPYIGSIAIPETWEGKYVTKESGQSIDFLYALPGDAGTPIFTIKLLTKAEWKKAEPAYAGFQVVKELPEHVFVARISNAVINDKAKAQEYLKMANEAKAAWSSFRSYDQSKK